VKSIALVAFIEPDNGVNIHRWNRYYYSHDVIGKNRRKWGKMNSFSQIMSWFREMASFNALSVVLVISVGWRIVAKIFFLG